jgi:hypothetical protein
VALSFDHAFIIPQISAKSIGNYPDIDLFLKDITPENRKFKFTKAVKAVSRKLGIPLTLEKKNGPEPYFYRVQEELAERWAAYYQFILQTLYRGIVNALDMPAATVETVQKALGDDGLLRYRKCGWIGRILSVFGYKGKVLYEPGTGEPIRKKEFDKLIKSIEDFLNRQTAGAGEKITLDSVAIGKLLRRMAKYQTTAAMENLTLDTLTYRGKTFDWISDSVKNIRDVMGEVLSRGEQARYQVAQDWAAHKVTRLNNEVRDEIKDTILGGIKNH